MTVRGFRRLILSALSVAAFGCGGSAPAPAHVEPAPTEPAAAPAPVPAAEPTPEPGPATLPVGAYVNDHVVVMVCEDPDGCEESVQDTLSVRAADDGAIAVTIELVRDNGHSCSFEGELAAAGDGTWTWTNPTPEEGEGCELTFAVDATTITITSEGCREHCGARAQLWGTFDR